MRLLRSVLCLALVFAAPNAHADAPFRSGASGLFIGHSFFAPVARQFDQIASATGYADHATQIVFAPGGAGTPGRMWQNARMKARVVDILDDGDIQIFGVAGMGRTTTFEQLDNWLRLALSHNPETTFLVTQVHIPGGPRAAVARYETNTTTAGNRLHTAVEALRRAHPTADIVFINHGLVASEMLKRFESGTLKDVTSKAGIGANTLFRDRAIGHAGRMMDYVSALVWLEHLYGTRPSELDALHYDRGDIDAITEATRAFHSRYE